MTPLEIEAAMVAEYLATLKELICKHGAGKASLMLRLEQLEQEAAVTYDRLLKQDSEKMARMN